MLPYNTDADTLAAVIVTYSLSRHLVQERQQNHRGQDADPGLSALVFSNI